MTRSSLLEVFSKHRRLRFTSDASPGIERVRVGTSFRYRNQNGRPIHDRAILERIRVLAIPPAWDEVWICPHANGHLQATGRDARGRKQYRYHPAFRSKREDEKFSRLETFGRALPKIRAAVRADLKRPGLPREKVLAAVVGLLDRTHLRVGNTEYVRANKSFGLSTLLDRHVAFSAGKLKLSFPGKSGIRAEREMTDARLARVVHNCRDLPGQKLFQYLDSDNKRHKIGSAEVNDYIRTAAGGPFTAKDFRTWAGTVQAVAMLEKEATPETKAAANRIICAAIAEVAKVLGNTPAVCRKSYIHPHVLEAFAAGEFPKARNDEMRVRRLLKPSKKTERE